MNDTTNICKFGTLNCQNLILTISEVMDGALELGLNILFVQEANARSGTFSHVRAIARNFGFTTHFGPLHEDICSVVTFYRHCDLEVWCPPGFHHGGRVQLNKTYTKKTEPLNPANFYTHAQNDAARNWLIADVLVSCVLRGILGSRFETGTASRVRAKWLDNWPMAARAYWTTTSTKRPNI